jgi:ubiquinone/menaquinone biosynthesis C-methylase UbiE
MVTYDIIANSYDELYKDEQVNKLNGILEEISFSSNDLILDVGCGSGIATSSLKCKIVGIDPSLKLLEKSPFLKVFGIGENLPFKDKSFNYVISLTAIHNFKDYKKGLKEMKRVGKKAIIVSVLKRSKMFDKINSFIFHSFKDVKIIDEEKDKIFIINLHEDNHVL